MATLDFGDLSGTERAVKEAIDVGAVRRTRLFSFVGQGIYVRFLLKIGSEQLW